MIQHWEPIVFFSDVHLSDQGPGDDFLPRLPRMMKLLEWARAEKIGRICTVGDFADCWETGAEKILDCYGDLFGLMFQFKWDYICGNHDQLNKMIPAFYEVFEGPRWLRLMVHRHRLILPKIKGDNPVNRFLPLLAMHGQRFDPIISKWPKLAGAVAILGGFMERHGFPQVDKWFSRFETWVGNVGRHDKSGGMDEKLQAYAKFQEFTTAIGGHTHRERREISADREEGFHFYFNTGSWTNADRPCRAVVIRPEAIQVIDAEDGAVKIVEEII